MKLNENKSNYMIFNFCKSRIFNTRIFMNDTLPEQTFGGPNLRGPNLALKHQYSNKKGISQNGDFEEAL